MGDAVLSVVRRAMRRAGFALVVAACGPHDPAVMRTPAPVPQIVPAEPPPAIRAFHVSVSAPTAGLPAVSGDGSTIVLPIESSTQDGTTLEVVFAQLGKTDGRRLRLGDHVDTLALGHDEAQQARVAEGVKALNVELAHGHYRPATWSLIGDRGGVSDGELRVDIAPAGEAPKLTVEVTYHGRSAGHFELAGTKLWPVGVVLLTSPQPVGYLFVSDKVQAGRPAVSSWHALPLTLAP